MNFQFYLFAIINQAWLHQTTIFWILSLYAEKKNILFCCSRVLIPLDPQRGSKRRSPVLTAQIADNFRIRLDTWLNSSSV